MIAMRFRSWHRPPDTETPPSDEQCPHEDLGDVLLAEARWLYEDRRRRSEAVQSASTGLVASFATVMTLPPVVVALTGQADWAARGSMIATIAVSCLGMILAVMATSRRKRSTKDLDQVRMTFIRLLISNIPCPQDLPEEVRRSLAENLIVDLGQDDMSIVKSLSTISDRQILWYQAARWALILASVLAATTLTLLATTIH